MLISLNGLLDQLEREFAANAKDACYDLLDQLRDLIAVNPCLLMHQRFRYWFESRATTTLINGWHLDRQRRTIQSLN